MSGVVVAGFSDFANNSAGIYGGENIAHVTVDVVLSAIIMKRGGYQYISGSNNVVVVVDLHLLTHI